MASQRNASLPPSEEVDSFLLFLHHISRPPSSFVQQQSESACCFSESVGSDHDAWGSNAQRKALNCEAKSFKVSSPKILSSPISSQNYTSTPEGLNTCESEPEPLDGDFLVLEAESYDESFDAIVLGFPEDGSIRFPQENRLRRALKALAKSSFAQNLAKPTEAFLWVPEQAAEISSHTAMAKAKETPVAAAAAKLISSQTLQESAGVLLNKAAEEASDIAVKRAADEAAGTTVTTAAKAWKNQATEAAVKFSLKETVDVSAETLSKQSTKNVIGITQKAANSAFNGACQSVCATVVVDSLGIGCDLIRHGSGTEIPPGQYARRLRNMARNCVGSSTGAAVGTLVFPGFGTVAGDVVGSILAGRLTEPLEKPIWNASVFPH